MILFEEYFSEDEAWLSLNSISDIRYVSTYHKYNQYLNERKREFDKLAEKITHYRKNKKFFEEWGIYDETIALNKEQISLLMNAIDIALEIHSNEEFDTYVGASKEAAYALKHKYKSYQEILLKE